MEKEEAEIILSNTLKEIDNMDEEFGISSPDLDDFRQALACAISVLHSKEVQNDD